MTDSKPSAPPQPGLDYNNWHDGEDEYDGPPDDCFHEACEVDILTGRATCHRCGDVWYPSDAELRAMTAEPTEDCPDCGARLPELCEHEPHCNRVDQGGGR